MRQKPTYKEFRAVFELDAAAKRQLMLALARKTVPEQLQIFKIRNEIFGTDKIAGTKNEQDWIDRLRKSHKDIYDYCILLLAIQIQMARATDSKYVTEIRKARQDTSSVRKITLARAVEVLAPLIRELRRNGATWQEVATVLNTKQKKILGKRKLTVDYLKKTWGRISEPAPLAT